MDGRAPAGCPDRLAGLPGRRVLRRNPRCPGGGTARDRAVASDSRKAAIRGGLAEDLVADTFERALKAGRRFDRRRGTEASWLYAIGMNNLRDHWRRQESRKGAISRLEHEATVREQPDFGEAVARRSIVREALAELSPEERDAIELRFGPT